MSPKPYLVTDRMRLERGAEHLHRLGPRAVYELLDQLGESTGERRAILRLLAEYQARLTPELVRSLGGHRFPPGPVRAVPSDLRRTV